MSFRRIEEIQIGNNPKGEAFGGFIYQLKVTLGFSGNPTSIIVDVISKDGIYNISPEDLSAIDPIAISIIDKNSINDSNKFAIAKFPTMYLVEYNFRQSAGQKVLSLEYLDRSIFLEKIWVGLAGKGALPHNLMPPQDGERFVFYNDKKAGSTASVKLPIRCAPCSKFKPPIIDPNTGRIIRAAGTEPSDMEDVQYENVQYPASYGWASNVDPERGGAIILGADEFTSNSCQISEVKYSWDELVYAMEANGIFISRDVDTGIPTINNRGKIYYRAQHANQNLKSVIGSWCQDFGFEWGWDPFYNEVYGRDLTKGTVNLSKIKNLVESFDDKSKVVISNYDQTQSIKQTHRQDHISWQQKPKKVKDTSFTSYRTQIWKNLSLVENSVVMRKPRAGGLAFNNGLFSQAEVKAGIFGMNRTEKEFLISCALAKYNKAARKIYLYKLAHEKANDGNYASLSDMSPLGIEAGYKFTQAEKQDFINTMMGQGFSHKEGGEDVDQGFKNLYGNDSDMYLVAYSEEQDKAWEAWEEKVADFIGKWYIDEVCAEGDSNWQNIINNPCEFKKCLGDIERELKISSSPTAQTHKAKPWHGYTMFPDDLNIRKEMPCPPGHNCEGRTITNSRFYLTQNCWDSYVDPEAAKGRGTMGAILNPNNECCSFVKGINNFTVLVRGWKYTFDQSDSSWQPVAPQGFNNQSMHRFPYHPGLRCGKEYIGGWINPFNCVDATGPAYYVVDGQGAMAAGFDYNGTPGVDGEGSFQVPTTYNKRNLELVTLTDGTVVQAEKVYLKAQDGWHDNVGCAVNPASATSPDWAKVGPNFFERILLLIDDPNPDRGKEWFSFSRDNNWSLTQDEFDKSILTSTKQNWLDGLVPELREVTMTARQYMGDLFEEFFAGVRAPMTSFHRNEKNNREPFLLFVPNPDVTEKFINFDDSNMSPNSTLANGKEVIFEDAEREESKEKCVIECDFDIIDRFCRCMKGTNYETPPEAKGLISRDCVGFTININLEEEVVDENANILMEDVVAKDGTIIMRRPKKKRSSRALQVKFPSTDNYLGYKRYDILSRQVIPAVQGSYGEITNAGNALKFNVNWHDITSDLDRWYPDPIENAVEPQGNNEVTRGYFNSSDDSVAGGGRIEEGIIVPPPYVNVKDPKSIFTTPFKYHNDLLNKGNKINNDIPMESLAFTMHGFDIDSILPFLNVREGLQGFNISYGSQGMVISFQFATKFADAGAISKTAWDTLYPQISFNAFGRGN